MKEDRFDTYGEWQPDYSKRITVEVERPVHRIANDYSYDVTPGDRTRIIIEGEHDLVTELTSDLQARFAAMRERL